MTEPEDQSQLADQRLTITATAPWPFTWLTEPVEVPLSVNFEKRIGTATLHPDGTIEGTVTNEVAYRWLVMGHGGGGSGVIRGISIKRGEVSLNRGTGDYGVKLVADDTNT